MLTQRVVSAMRGTITRPARWLLLGALAAGLSACGTAGATAAHPAAAAPPAVMDSSGPMNMNLKPLNQPLRPMTLVRNGNQVTINLYTEQRIVTVAPGVRFAAWTFDGTVPGPVIHLRQGDDVTLVLHNLDPDMPHSIDLHAAQVAPNLNYVDVPPGQSRTIRFVASVPGVFMYHCATQPGLLHMEKGMYGAVVVDPPGPTAGGPEYVPVQSEFYDSMNSLLNGAPTYVVFNGEANRYMSAPLHAQVGVPVRFAVVNAGPNDWSAFHVIGAILDTVQPSGSPDTVFHDLQTWTIAPGDGALITVVFRQPGTYKFVTHAFRDVDKGAEGSVLVSD
ncbi:MAG: multicopper oxidase domain-containing protein [Actinomycetia bacterium]|nr:multicopper oxidase domain-containing protein [Actinomycetes bacterium]